MARGATVFEILIASPSDLVEERDLVRESIQQWNVLHGRHRECVLEAVMWETHTTPDFGDRPQAIINRQIVDSCDALIGTFWTRLGSPTGEAPSGTVEEIERIAAANKPVMLYFSSRQIDPSRIDTTQLEALREFQKECRTKSLCEDYATPSELSGKLAMGLTRLVDRLLVKREPEPATVNKPDRLTSALRRMLKEWYLITQSRSRLQEGKELMQRFGQLYFDNLELLGGQEAIWETLAHLANGLVDYQVSLDSGSRERFAEMGEAILVESLSVVDEGSTGIELDQLSVDILKKIYFGKKPGQRESKEGIIQSLGRREADISAALDALEKLQLIETQTYFNGPDDYSLRGRGLVLLNVHGRISAEAERP